MNGGTPIFFGTFPSGCKPSFSVFVAAGVATKAQLLATLDEQFRFPEYFGSNWDALEECIRDLSWLSPGTIALVHEGLPMADDVPNLKIYLAILQGAVVGKKSSSRNPLVVVFPRRWRERIEPLLKAQ